jgi:uncharacterized protein with HEPN domain
VRSDRERLYDILDAVDRIDSQVTRGRDIFVWSVAENDLPKLGAQIRAIIDQLP